jgi:hypothetical protein
MDVLLEKSIMFYLKNIYENMGGREYGKINNALRGKGKKSI